MTQITIPNIDDQTLQGLKQLASRRGLPLQESLLRLLQDAVEEEPDRWHAKNFRNSEMNKRVAAEAA